MTYKGDYYVSTETEVMHKVDPEALETIKKVRLLNVNIEVVIVYRSLFQFLWHKSVGLKKKS